MTVKETAEYLRILLPTVYYLVQRGQLPAIQIGGRWRIKRSLLDRDILRTEGSGQPTVLVVDDDPALQQLFKQFLKKAGFGRIVVGTGGEAIQFAEKQKFDLVFLDLKLPDISGDELYKKFQIASPRLADCHHHRLSGQRNPEQNPGRWASHGHPKADRI